MFEDIVENKKIHREPDEFIEEPSGPKRTWYGTVLHFGSLLLCTLIFGIISFIFGFCCHLVINAFEGGWYTAEDLFDWWTDR